MHKQETLGTGERRSTPDKNYFRSFQFWAGSGFDFLSISKLHADAASLSLTRRKQTNINTNTVSDLVLGVSVNVSVSDRNVRIAKSNTRVSKVRAARAARFALAA